MPASTLIPRSTSGPAPTGDGALEPLRAVHTPDFPDLLRRLGASLLVTVLPGRRWPELPNEDELLENSFVVPHEALADVPAALRA
jgi:hypothetical protein